MHSGFHGLEPVGRAISKAQSGSAVLSDVHEIFKVARQVEQALQTALSTKEKKRAAEILHERRNFISCPTHRAAHFLVPKYRGKCLSKKYVFNPMITSQKWQLGKIFMGEKCCPISLHTKPYQVSGQGSYWTIRQSIYFLHAVFPFVSMIQPPHIAALKYIPPSTW